MERGENGSDAKAERLGVAHRRSAHRTPLKPCAALRCATTIWYGMVIAPQSSCCAAATRAEITEDSGYLYDTALQTVLLIAGCYGYEKGIRKMRKVNERHK
eukprot:3523357-Pleurochrysis_carterae.AAC.2